MMNIEFTPEESDVLLELLQNERKKIDVEISRTDTHEFKELLKHRRSVLEHVLAKLSAVPIA